MTRDEIISGLEREVKSIRREPPRKMLGICMTADEAEDIIAILKEQPELVRCKDCKYGAPTIINGVWLSVTCGGLDHRPDWFRADGKRTTE